MKTILLVLALIYFMIVGIIFIFKADKIKEFSIKHERPHLLRASRDVWSYRMIGVIGIVTAIICGLVLIRPGR